MIAHRPLPGAVSVDLDQPVLTYWRARLAQHLEDTYAGIRISKFPEDLRVYEHLLWEAEATTVIEIGAQFGASALWFRDRIAAFGRYRPGPSPRVVAIDVDIAPALEALDASDPAWRDSITLVEGDVLDPSLPSRIGELLPAGSRCLVVEDSAHVHATTRAALDGFARFVSPGSFFVVEDGCVDVEALRLDDGWPRGVHAAVGEWLATDGARDFALRPDLELYGITCHPGGYLHRLR